jgi:hypothetical protein
LRGFDLRHGPHIGTFAFEQYGGVVIGWGCLRAASVLVLTQHLRGVLPAKQFVIYALSFGLESCESHERRREHKVKLNVDRVLRLKVERRRPRRRSLRHVLLKR